MTDKHSFWDGKRPEQESFATKDDIKDLEKKIDNMAKKDEPVQTQGAARKLVGGLAHGLGDIGRSLASPENKKRMRIAQMPGRKPPIARTKVENPIAGRGAGIKKRRISNAPLD